VVVAVLANGGNGALVVVWGWGLLLLVVVDCMEQR
jgi:hypothetical protein